MRTQAEPGVAQATGDGLPARAGLLKEVIW